MLKANNISRRGQVQVSVNRVSGALTAVVKYFALRYPAEARNNQQPAFLVLLNPHHGETLEGRVLPSGETVFTVAKLPQKLDSACVQGDVVPGDVVQYMRQLRHGGHSYAVKKLNLASANATHFPVLLNLKLAQQRLRRPVYSNLYQCNLMYSTL